MYNGLLYNHLYALLQLRHTTITEVILIVPTSPDAKDRCPGYYRGVDKIKERLLNEKGIKFTIFQTQNQGMSCGQWLRYMIRHDEHAEDEMYMCMEEDYIPYTDDFDTKLTEMYYDRFQDGEGLLCGYTLGYPKEDSMDRKHVAFHWNGLLMISRKSFKRMHHWWNNTKIRHPSMPPDNTPNPYLHALDFLGGPNAQISLSLIFEYAGILSEDISAFGCPFYYWEDGYDSFCLFTQPGINRNHATYIQRSEWPMKIFSTRHPPELIVTPNQMGRRCLVLIGDSSKYSFIPNRITELPFDEIPPTTPPTAPPVEYLSFMRAVDRTIHEITTLADKLHSRLVSPVFCFLDDSFKLSHRSLLWNHQCVIIRPTDDLTTTNRKICHALRLATDAPVVTPCFGLKTAKYINQT